MFLFCVECGHIKKKQKHFLIPTETEMKITRSREIHEWVFSLFCASSDLTRSRTLAVIDKNMPQANYTAQLVII